MMFTNAEFHVQKGKTKQPKETLKKSLHLITIGTIRKF